MRRPGNVWLDQHAVIHLVREAQRGELRALDVLLATLRPSFLTFFAERLESDAAEDATQEALIRVAGAFQRIDPERAGEYVVTITENLLRWERRRRSRDVRRRAPVELAEDVEAPDVADAEVDQRDLARALQASVAALSPKLHETVLALLRGLEPTEIAAQWQMNPVTIRRRLMLARARLRSELRDYR